MTTSNDLQIPDDLDEALTWLLDALRDPAKKERLSADRKTTAAFIEKATLVLSALAKRDGQSALSFLLSQAATEAREQLEN